MTYFEQLRPWCIIRVLANKQQLDNRGVPSVGKQSNVVARFRRHSDAVAYLQVLNNSIKNVKLLIVFDVQGVKKSRE